MKCTYKYDGSAFSLRNVSVFIYGVFRVITYTNSIMMDGDKKIVGDSEGKFYVLTPVLDDVVFK